MTFDRFGRNVFLSSISSAYVLQVNGFSLLTL